jgi:predicted ester cyclase
MSDVEQNVALVRRFYDEVLNRNQLDRLEEFVSPDFVDTNPGADAAAGGQRPPGIEQIRQWWQMVLRAFPDTHVEFDVLFGEGDKVIEHSTIRGTQTGPWMALPPSGTQVTWEMTTMYRIEDGKLVERWGAYDVPSLMQQLGLVKGGPLAAGPPAR